MIILYNYIGTRFFMLNDCFFLYIYYIVFIANDKNLKKARQQIYSDHKWAINERNLLS